MFVLALATITTAAATSGSEAGAAAKVTVIIDGDTTGSAISATIINGASYVPLQGFCAELGAQSTIINEDSVTILAPGLKIEATDGMRYITANGRYLFVPAGCKMLDGELAAPIRTLAAAFDAQVSWNGASKTVYVTTGSGVIASGDAFYNDNDVHWMSRIISAEAGGESFLGKIAVGNVIMNRIASPQFPSSVYDVIFDRRSGIQFTPAYSGAINCNPSAESVIAAKLALDGAVVVGDSLYFSQSYLGCWAARNRPFTATIGNHSFYA